MTCPKCGFEQPDGSTDCLRCGIVFRKVQQIAATRPSRVPVSVPADDRVVDGRIGASELRILGIGLVAAILVYAFPLTRMIFSALVTLLHELGHAVVGWLLGIPSIPAFDLTYGGGFTHMGEFHLSIAITVAACFAYLAWLFRESRKALAIIGIVFLVWLFFVTKEWRRETAIAAAGHAAEFVLAGILFYQALAGVGWRNPDLERPLGAFAAFFVQIHSMLFARRLTNDADFLTAYRDGKDGGGALMNDLEVVALNIQIYMGKAPEIAGVARALLWFSFIPIAVALVWHFKRSRWHRALRALRTADV